MTKEEFKQAIIEAVTKWLAAHPKIDTNLEDQLIWFEATRLADEMDRHDIAHLFIEGVTQITADNWFADLENQYDDQVQYGDEELGDWMDAIISHFQGKSP